MADRTESIILDFEVDLEDSVESINSLTKQSKALREERNKLNIQSETGKKRAAEINALLDQNTNKIKSNSSAIERQRANIGNYKSALDGVHPALGKVGAGLEQGASGFKAMTLQALRFIATPIGAILAALVAVFGLLKAAISTNNEFLDKFENITNAVGVVLNVVIQRVGKLGEALIAFASGDFNKALDLTAAAFTGLAAEIESAVAQGQLYLDLSRDLEDAQRALRIETARQENEIKRLVVAAKNQSLTLEQQEGLLRQALALEEQLVAKRAENAQKDLVITAKRIALDKAISQSSEETFEEFVDRLVNSTKLQDEQVDEIISKIEALEQARGSSLAFQEKVENSLAVITEKRNKQLEEQNALLAANRRAQDNVNTETDDPLTGAFQTQLDNRLEIQKNFDDRLTQQQKEAELERIRNAFRSAKAQEQIEQNLQDAKTNAIVGFLGVASSLFDKESEEYKAFATFQTLISTYSTAQKAYEAAFVPPTVASPALGAINVGLAIAQGLANLAAINGVQFAEGGWTGPGNKMDAVGVVHADEYVVPKRIVNNPMAQPQLAMLESMRLRGYADGGLTTNTITQPINQQLEISNILKNMPAPVVSVKEINREQKRVRVKEHISKR